MDDEDAKLDWEAQQQAEGEARGQAEAEEAAYYYEFGFEIDIVSKLPWQNCMNLVDLLHTIRIDIV